MEENKKNYALWLYPETVRRMDSSLELANCQSRSEFVEKALHFYMGYLVTDDTTEYLSKALLTSIQGMLDANDDRIRSLLFKLCVETNMMMHVIAAHFKDDIGDLACMIRMLHHMGNIFRDNVGSTGYRGLQLDRKRRKELQEWKIALGHREDDHEDPANYPKPAY